MTSEWALATTLELQHGVGIKVMTRLVMTRLTRYAYHQRGRPAPDIRQMVADLCGNHGKPLSWRGSFCEGTIVREGGSTRFLPIHPGSGVVVAVVSPPCAENPAPGPKP